MLWESNYIHLYPRKMNYLPGTASLIEEIDSKFGVTLQISVNRVFIFMILFTFKAAILFYVI